MLLSVEQVTKSYGDRVLLDGVSFYLERGDKVGIIGVNGAGKSPLLRLLAGAEEPDGGTVRLDPGVRMEYLPQNPVFQGERTVLEQVLLGLNDADRSLAEYEARTILNRLGVSRFEQSVGNLSGGERRRVALAAVLARPCDVLILDEPTNHLDNDMVLWLEDYLRAWKGALVMVTHDRYFLERGPHGGGGGRPPVHLRGQLRQVSGAQGRPAGERAGQRAQAAGHPAAGVPVGDAGAHRPGNQEQGAAGALRGPEGPERPGGKKYLGTKRAGQPSR